MKLGKWATCTLAAFSSALLLGCPEKTPSEAPSPAPPEPIPTHIAPAKLPETAPDSGPIHETIAKGLIAASGPNSPQSAAGRDAAARAFATFNTLLNNCDDPILWGSYGNATTLDPGDHAVSLVHPLVWATSYLPLFQFGPNHEVRKDGEYTVLEIAATFRATLPPGEYPYPFWHSPEEWSTYVNTKSLLLVFLDNRLFAGYMKATPAHVATPKWDGQWGWTAPDGSTQPRAAQLSFVLSPNNPHTADATAAYAILHQELRTNNCISCHSPANSERLQVLPLLMTPAAALASRHAIAAVLRENSMPPGDFEHGKEAGLASESARQSLIRAADEFARTADAALLHESDLRGVPRPAPLPPRNDPRDKMNTGG